MMDDLRTMIEDAVRDVRPSADAFERAARRARSRQRRRRAGAVVVAIGVATAGTLLVWRSFAPPPRIPTATPIGVIAFATQGPDDMTPVIAKMAPDGSGVTPLVPGDEPAISPDGSRIAFSHATEEGTGIFVMDADGTDVRRITTNADGEDASPSWSPDGATIVFSRSRFVITDPDPVASRSRRDLYTVSVDGGRPTELLGGPTDDFDPDWSPDGTRIAFVRMADPASDGPDATPQIWTLELQGSDAVQLTDTRLGAWRPDWAPDGSRVAFDAGDSIVVVDANGGTPSRVELPSSVASPFDPVWSPDGERLAFVAGVDEEHDIFVVSADGSGLHQVERPGSNDASPSWGRPPAAGSPSPSPSTSAPPTGEGRDIGLAFNLCHVETLGRLDLLGDGASGRAWTGVPVKDDGTCPRFAGPMKYVLAVDHTGDGQADSWLDLPFGCWNRCAPYDATDLDGDGSEELVVVSTFSIMDYFFFTVRPDADGDLRVEPILVAEPGHPPADIEAGAPLRIDAWGDAGYGASIQCEGYPSAPVIVWSWSSSVIESDEPAEVHVTRIQLQADGLFHVVGTNDYTVPAGQPTGVPYQGDLPAACGVRW